MGSALAAFATHPGRKKTAGAARREAIAQDKRRFAKRCQRMRNSLLGGNDVYDLVDIRKTPVQNYVTGHW
eukprot:8134901-Prorocentrum_lima.AAC.1